MKLALVALVTFAVPAHADVCGDMVRLDNAVNALLVQANDPTNKMDASYLDRCARDLVIPGTKELLGRFNIACAAILEANPAHVICVSASIEIDKHKVGSVQLFDSVRGWEHDPWTGLRTPTGANRVLALYAKLGDARAVPVVRETWKAAAAEAASKEQTLVGWQKKQAIATWRRWRAQAAALLAELGDASAAEFLEDEHGITTDVVVTRACRDAVRAIKRRVKK